MVGGIGVVVVGVVGVVVVGAVGVVEVGEGGVMVGCVAVGAGGDGGYTIGLGFAVPGVVGLTMGTVSTCVANTEDEKSIRFS